MKEPSMSFLDKAKVADLREKADEVLGGNDAAADTASASESI